MHIAVIGTGYVGLVTGACLADVGHNVVCVDVDVDKIEKLKAGILPIYEPGLEMIVGKNLHCGRLQFATEMPVENDGVMIYFIAVGTPPNSDGSANLQYVMEVAKEIGKRINTYTVVIDKSTVPVGTGAKVTEIINHELCLRGLAIPFDIVSNPEFLKEGAAVNDFMRPDRIIVGCTSERTKEIMKRIYAPFNRNRDRMIFMGVKAAEMSKYAANAMLALRISFINEIANVCDHFDIDVEDVRKGIGSDPRIGYSFLYAGCGYGGSCFPKDVKALVEFANKANIQPTILNAIEKRNTIQKQVLFDKITSYYNGELQGKNFGLWGLSFKPGTDDMREAPSIPLIYKLIGGGANISAYDPIAMDKAKAIFPEEWFSSGKLKFVDEQYEALQGAHAMILVTEWNSFRDPDFERMTKIMHEYVLFDGRNQYDLAVVKEYGFKYFGIGRSSK